MDSNWAGWYIDGDSSENMSEVELVRVKVEEEYSKCILPMLMNLETQGVTLQ